MKRIAGIGFGMILRTALGALLLTVPSLGFTETGETIGSGDQVRITVFQNPDLTTETRVSERGTIVFPLVGEIEVAGETPAGAGSRIAEQLRSRSVMKNPQVGFVITQVRSRQVSVLGQVGRPGRYALDEKSMKLTDLLALAGGITATGDDTIMVVGIRDGKSVRTEVDVSSMYRNGGSLAKNLEIRNGDSIFVPRAQVFYIFGEVNRSGAYRLEPDLRVVQAISLGGGVTLRGTTRDLKIHRRLGDGSLQRIDARLGDALQADDVIFVKESLF